MNRSELKADDAIVSDPPANLQQAGETEESKFYIGTVKFQTYGNSEILRGTRGELCFNESWIALMR